MSEKKRVFLLGNDRAEFEHVFGPLQVAEDDPRFVLVDAETEEAIRKFPAGVPPIRGQNWEDVKKIRAAELDVAGVDHDLGDSVKDEPVTKVQKGSDSSKNVAESGTPISTEAPTYGSEKAEFSDEDSKPAKSSAKKGK